MMAKSLGRLLRSQQQDCLSKKSVWRRQKWGSAPTPDWQTLCRNTCSLCLNYHRLMRWGKQIWGGERIGDHMKGEEKEMMKDEEDERHEHPLTHTLRPATGDTCVSCHSSVVFRDSQKESQSPPHPRATRTRIFLCPHFHVTPDLISMPGIFLQRDLRGAVSGSKSPFSLYTHSVHASHRV